MTIRAEAPLGLAAFGSTTDAATVGASGTSSLERLVRPLLSALTEIGQFDAAYLTVVDWGRRQLEVRFVHNATGLDVPEGHRIECPAGLAEKTFLGVTGSEDAGPPQLDGHVADGLGVADYVSVPIVTIQHRLFGTLCGANRARRHVADGTASVMEYFARLIVDHLARAEVARNQQRAALAEERLQDRAMFLADAEHELKTPLTVITGFVALLEERSGGLSEPDAAAALAAINRNTQLLAEQVNRLLEEAMAEAKTRDLHLTAVDARDAIRPLIQAFAAASGGRDLRVDAEVGERVSVDPAVLDQVLGHLLDNAIKYSSAETSITVRVRRAGPCVEIDVVDEGVGIPTDIDVFAAFQRGPADLVQGRVGVGLGLHIVRNLTRAMGGEVIARRNADCGSTFTLRLPAAG